MADGSGGASTAVLVYLHRVATGVTVVDNNGDSGVDIGGGDGGYTLVAGGSDPPPNWAVEEQQDGRNYAEDERGR